MGNVLSKWIAPQPAGEASEKKKAGLRPGSWPPETATPPSPEQMPIRIDSPQILLASPTEKSKLSCFAFSCLSVKFEFSFLFFMVAPFSPYSPSILKFLFFSQTHFSTPPIPKPDQPVNARRVKSLVEKKIANRQDSQSSRTRGRKEKERIEHLLSRRQRIWAKAEVLFQPNPNSI